jgi:hypothetical protein
VIYGNKPYVGVIDAGDTRAAQRSNTIEDCVKKIRSAWDAGDAAAFDAEFTEDAT